MTVVDAPELPEEAAVALKSAYEEYARAISERSGDKERIKRATTLANLTTLGRNAGWSYRALARYCGVTPERLRQITTAHATPDKVRKAPKFPQYEVPRDPAPHPQGRYKHLTADEARTLRDLAGDARRNTGSRPMDSPFRKSSEEFSRLIMKHHDEGVIWDEISDATRAWETWPLQGEVHDFCMEMRDLRRSQQKLRNERKDVSAALRSALAKHRAAVRHGYPQAEIKARAAEVEAVRKHRTQSLALLKETSTRIDEMVKQDTLPPQHTVSGIRARAARHGYGKGAPPSIAPYLRIVVTPPPGGKRKVA